MKLKFLVTNWFDGLVYRYRSGDKIVVNYVPCNLFTVSGTVSGFWLESHRFRAV